MLIQSSVPFVPVFGIRGRHHRQKNSERGLGYFFNLWKKATIIVIFKPGNDPKKIENYRPISLLDVLGKVIEKVLEERLHDFEIESELIPPTQFGFRKSLSTGEPIINLVNQVTQSINLKLYFWYGKGLWQSLVLLFNYQTYQVRIPQILRENYRLISNEPNRPSKDQSHFISSFPSHWRCIPRLDSRSHFHVIHCGSSHSPPYHQLTLLRRRHRNLDILMQNSSFQCPPDKLV